MLGPIGAQAVGKITVYSPSHSGEQLQSFTAWIPAELLKESGIARGITVSVSVSLEGVQILGCGYSWLCDCFEVLDRTSLPAGDKSTTLNSAHSNRVRKPDGPPCRIVVNRDAN